MQHLVTMIPTEHFHWFSLRYQMKQKQQRSWNETLLESKLQNAFIMKTQLQITLILDNVKWNKALKDQKKITKNLKETV